MKAITLGNDRFDEWDAFVDTSTQASIYYKTWYLHTLDKPFDIFAVVENESIIGGYVSIKNRIKQYSNPLLCKYLGIIYGALEGSEYTVENKRRKINELLLPAFQNKRSFNYSFHPEYRDHLWLSWQGFAATTMYTYIIPLKGREEEAILADMHSKLRSEIRFGEKAGYTIVPEVEFDAFYDINAKTYLRQGGQPPFKKEYLRRYCEELRGKNALRLMGISDSGKLMAVAGIIHDRHAASLVLSGFDPETIGRGANELLIWETIRWALQHSDSYDFEGSMMAPIDSFYRKFGGKHTPFLRIFKDNLLNQFTQKARHYYKKMKYGK